MFLHASKVVLAKQRRKSPRAIFTSLSLSYAIPLRVFPLYLNEVRHHVEVEYRTTTAAAFLRSNAQKNASLLAFGIVKRYKILS